MRSIIKNTGKGQKRIDSNEVAEALGAEKVGGKVNTKHNPVSLFFLREILINRLRSSGGRPALVGTTKERKKYPFLKKIGTNLN